MKKGPFIIIIAFVSLVSIAMIHHNFKHISYLHDYISHLKQSAIKQRAQFKTTVIVPPNPTFYEAGNLPIPFGDFTAAAPESAINAENPLLSYPVNVLRFVGTLSQGNTVSAFVVAPDNVVYQVSLGDAIGPHHGKVMRIDQQRLDVVEIDNNTGKPKEILVTLQLKEEH
jgi:type IV pilus assembly protein PilP